MKRLYVLAFLLLVGSNISAQDVDSTYLTETIISPQFFITVIAGVILALGFQFILTALSVAAGISAIGDVKESYVKSKNHTGGKEHFNDKEEDDNKDHTATGTLITTGFGIWSTLTVAISLFGATAFAMNLTLIANPLIAITLALVIWATFFILLFYLESKVVNTMIGGLINTATAGLRSSASAVKGMLAPSEASKMEDMADHTIEKVRKEFQNSFDSDMFHNAIDDFFTKFDKKIPAYDKVKKDIEQIVDESVEKSNSQNNSNNSSSSPAKWMAIQSVLNTAIGKSSNDNSEQGKSKTEQLKRLQSELKQAYGEGNTTEEKTEKVLAKLTPADEEEIGSYIEKIKQFISQDGSGSMDTKEIEQRVKEIIKNPTAEASKIGHKIGELDRATIVTFLSKNTSLDRTQLENYADKFEQALRTVQVELSSDNSDSMINEFKEQIEKILSGLTGSSDGSSMDFSHLSTILQGKMDDQKENLDSIKNRLLNTDKEDMIALVTNNSKVDREDIDKVVNSFEDAKSKVLENIQKIENTATEKLKMIERKAVIQAEHARETAAAAAWWLVVSAVFSACAAIGGSLLTLF